MGIRGDRIPEGGWLRNEKVAEKLIREEMIMGNTTAISF